MWIFFLCMIVVIIIIIFYVNNNTSVTESWAKFANDTGLNITVEQSLPKITGKYKGFDYMLETFTQGSDYGIVTFTVITILLPEAVNYHFHIYYENSWDKMEKMLGEKDIQIGNKEFDSSFIIQSQTPDKINKVFTSELQRKMLYRSDLINISLSGNKIVNETSKLIKNQGELLYLSEILLEVAINAFDKELDSLER